MKKDIIKIIDMYKDIDSFSKNNNSNKVIKYAEKILKRSLPEDFKWFLRNYGSGGILGINILGITSNDRMLFVDYTLEYRKEFSMPVNLVIIENCDEYFYCIDLDSYKIMNWSMDNNESYFSYENFEEFLLDRLKNAVENLTEKEVEYYAHRNSLKNQRNNFKKYLTNDLFYEISQLAQPALIALELESEDYPNEIVSYFLGTQKEFYKDSSEFKKNNNIKELRISELTEKLQKQNFLINSIYLIDNQGNKFAYVFFDMEKYPAEKIYDFLFPFQSSAVYEKKYYPFDYIQLESGYYVTDNENYGIIDFSADLKMPNTEFKEKMKNSRYLSFIFYHKTIANGPIFSDMNIINYFCNLKYYPRYKMNCYLWLEDINEIINDKKAVKLNLESKGKEKICFNRNNRDNKVYYFKNNKIKKEICGEKDIECIEFNEYIKEFTIEYEDGFNYIYKNCQGHKDAKEVQDILLNNKSNKISGFIVTSSSNYEIINSNNYLLIENYNILTFNELISNLEKSLEITISLKINYNEKEKYSFNNILNSIEYFPKEFKIT